MSTAKPPRNAAEDQLLIRAITPEGQPAVDVGGVNVLLGPNNVGKTAALRDLVLLAGNFDLAGKELQAGEELVTKVIRDITFVGKLSLDRLTRGLTSVGDATAEGTTLQGIGPDLRTPYQRSIGPEIKSVLYRPVITARSVRTTVLGQIMPLRVAYLEADRSGDLLSPTSASSPLQAPENLLQALLYADSAVHDELDAACQAVFPEFHVRLDATERVNLYLRVAGEFPPSSSDAVSAVRQYAMLRRADQEGAGLRHLLSVVMTMLLCQGRVVLLDQPEAGLFPPQAQQLGRWIAQNAPRLSCQVFLATQSPALLRGLFEASSEVTALRLSRTGDTTRFQLVPADVGSTLARFPLLSGQQALECLFCDGVVLVPGADDRIVYETVAQRFVGSGNLRFVQAHGDRNLAALAKIFRKAELPLCVVSELGILQSEAGFSELVKAVTGNPPPAPWLATRDRLTKYVDGMGEERELSATAHEVESFLDQLKKGGNAEAAQAQAPARLDVRGRWLQLQREQMANVPPELRVWVEELLDDLKHQGIFLSPRGNYQAWMSSDPLLRDPEVALAKAVQTLHRGECPADLRAFVGEIIAYLRVLLSPAKPARLKNTT
jgi:ABC-type uncharacterized transport system ATPase subunit